MCVEFYQQSGWSRSQMQVRPPLFPGKGRGEFFTLPQAFDGGRSEINARTGCGGTVAVELWERQADGSAGPVENLTFQDHVPFRGDAVWTPCRWRRGGDLGALAGRTIELRFRLVNAKLFAFRFR